MVKSITLDELIDKLQTYKSFHRNEGDLMVFFDALHIKGELIKTGNVLEMF